VNGYRDLKIELERKERTVSEQIEKSPQLQEVLTEKQKLECSLFSTMGIKEKGGVTLGFPAEIILNIMSFCDKKTLLSLFLTNKETNQSVQSFINTSPSIFFKKFYPSFISLEVKPVKIFAVPPLDQNLFKEPTPLKLLQSLPKVFKHKLNEHIYGMLPLPYAKAFLEFLQLVARNHPKIRKIVTSYPLPVWIGPVMEPLKTDIKLGEEKNLDVVYKAYKKATYATISLLEGTGALLQQYRRVILQAAKTDHDCCTVVPPFHVPEPCVLRAFIQEFFQPNAVSEASLGENLPRCVSFDEMTYRAIIKHMSDDEEQDAWTREPSMETPGPETAQSMLQTIHLCFDDDLLPSSHVPPMPQVCKEIVLDNLKKKNNMYNWQSFISCNLKHLCSGIKVDSHTVNTLRLLNYPLTKKTLSCIFSPKQAITNLIIHVPKDWQLTEGVKADLQKSLNKFKTLKSIEIRTAYNGIDWHQSQPLGQFSKTSESSQKS
jgi:hypothetical protein